MVITPKGRWVIISRHAILHKFYSSALWQKFRAITIAERGLMCEYCGKVVARSNELTLHHIKELTPENVSDYNISLNPENVSVVHYECHGKIHHRFGYQPSKANRNVYIVYGPPMAGKKTLVRDRMQRGDIVVDIDRIYSAVSLLPEYDKPDNLFNNVRGIHNLLIDNIKTRFGKWNSAWVIGGYADKYKRKKLVSDLGAELIFCDITQEECVERLKQDEALKYRYDEFLSYIDKWFASHMA